MPGPKTTREAGRSPSSPPLLRDENDRIEIDSVPDVIQWFLDYDERVAIVRHPRVEEVFQWKQQLSRSSGEEVFIFPRAEDRLAIGIIQALAENSSQALLHSRISQLLNALETASKSNESAADIYRLNLKGSGSVVQEAVKIPSDSARQEFLINCWLEALCTAEARVLGWLYKEFFGYPFVP
jgi:hypothetical protein